MSKRSSEQSGSPTKRFKDTHDSSDSETEAGDDTVLNFSTTYAPDQMLKLIYSFEEFCANTDVTVKNLEKVATDWSAKVNSEQAEPIDVSVFCSDFRKYLRQSTKVGNFELKEAAMCTRTYLSKGKALEAFKDYPSRPQKMIQLYYKQKNIKCVNFGQYHSVFEMMKNEDQGFIDKLHEEQTKQEAQYLTELKEFRNRHPTLTQSQELSLSTKITSLEKKFAKDTPVKKRTKPVKKEPLTAFSLWAKTKSDKYTNLPEKEREAKLRKKFEKLSDSERKLLEDLVISQ